MDKSIIITIILIVIVITGMILFAPEALKESTIILEVAGESITMTESNYQVMKDFLIGKYENKEAFTFNEWQLFTVVLNREAIEIELKNIEGEPLVPLIINEIE